MRNRRNVITIRMDDSEYELLKKRVKESGLTQQAFVINAIGMKILCLNLYQIF